MKKLLSSIIFLILCGTHTLSQAYDIIKISTFNDENGSNPDTCSLREAIETNNRNASYGGCVSNTKKYYSVQLLLPSGTYYLTNGEIVVKKDIEIFGTDPYIYDAIDPITQKKPKKQRPNTIIDGRNQSRLFNSSTDLASISLTHLKLQNGYADRGGAILSGGAVTLTNTILSNNKANLSGGSIFLDGGSATLTMTTSNIEQNNAPQGSAFGMTCFNNFTPDNRKVTITQSSIISNGDTTSSSTIEGCGNLVLSISASTVAKNRTQDDGSIIQLVNKLGSTAAIALGFDTIIENQTGSVIHYGNLSSLAMANTILAYNSSQDCKAEGATSTAYYDSANIIQNCTALGKAINSVTIQPNITPLTSQFEYTKNSNNEINALNDYGGLTYSYLPKMGSYLVDKADGATNKSSGCTAVNDQRDVNRAGDFSCDIGAVERMQLFAVDEPQTISNESKTNRIAETDVLANDTPMETATARSLIEDGTYQITLDSGNASCKLGAPDSNGIIKSIIFDTKGALIDTESICSYHLSKDGINSNSAKVRFKIINQNPIANNDDVFLNYSSTSVTFDVLSNDNDEGDGIYGQLYNSDKKPPLNIILTTEPEIGTLHAENEGDCPSIIPATKKRCLGGKITYYPKNSISPFGDTFQYQVIDQNGAVSSDATVTIHNTAQDSNKDGSGGGSIGLFSILALFGLMLTRRNLSH